MNKKLIEFNDYIGASIDDDGDVNIIKKNNNKYEFKDILKKENELEVLNYRLNISNNDYLKAKRNIKNKRLAIIIPSVISFILSLTFFKSPLLSLGIFTIFETMTILLCEYYYGYTKSNKNIMNESNYETARLETKIEDLEKELSIIKSQVNYNSYEDTLAEDIINNEPNLPYDIIQYPLDEKPLKRVRVLDLTKK